MTQLEKWPEKPEEDQFLHPGITERWDVHPDQRDQHDWECVNKKKREAIALSTVFVYVLVAALFALSILGAVLKLRL